MKVSTGKDAILETIRLLNDCGLFNNKLGCISLKIDNENILISPCIEYKHFTLDDIVLTSINHVARNIESEELAIHQHIYKTRKETRAITHIYSPGVLQKSTDYEIVPPVLEDMVQIIGPTINISDNSAKSVVKLLKGRSGVLIKNNGGICIGNSLEETLRVCQVLEKSCLVFTEAKKIGGAKPLDMATAYLMRQVYLRNKPRSK